MTMTLPTEEFMVAELQKHFKDIPIRDQIVFKNSIEPDLVDYHHSVCAEIRERFNLWYYPWQEELDNGVDCSPEHPENVSMRVLKELWNRVKV